jgi:putative transposase
MRSYFTRHTERLSGCPWRMLPWPTVYYQFRRFRLSGLWHRAFAILRAAERKRVGKNPDASVYGAEG